MPMAAPRICPCGHKIASSARCPCQVRRDRERKARADKNRAPARERGYTSKWQREREAYLKAHPACARPGCNATATVLDHIQPHRGDFKLFWRRSNWQGLCRSCHAGWKQRLECREAI